MGNVTKWVVVAAFMVVGSQTARAHGDDAKTTAELKSMCEKMNSSWMKGDLNAFRSLLSDNIWGAWDLDMAGRPANMASPADVTKLFTDVQGAMKKMGGTMGWTEKAVDCHASGDLGICTVVGEQTVSIPKMPPMVMTIRNTEVLHKDKSGWKFVHHHGSVAKAPDMPGKTMAMTAKTAKTMEMPGMPPGVSVAPIWMNPVTQSMAGILKVGKEGMKQPKHLHPYAQTMVVLEGTMVTSDAANKDAEYKAGSVVYRAPNEVHTTTVKPNSSVFVVTDGPLISIEVDDKGNPKTASR